MVNDTIYSIHGSYGILTISTLVSRLDHLEGLSLLRVVLSPRGALKADRRRCSEMDFVEILSNHRDSTVNIIYIYIIIIIITINNNNNKYNNIYIYTRYDMLCLDMDMDMIRMYIYI